MNQFIEESVKSMLHDQDLTKFLWGEATKTVVYIKNKTPHRSLDNMTPEEAFTRKKPSIDHLWIFGFLVYIYVPKDKRKKLDPSSMKRTFFGYNSSSKAYRIYIKEGTWIEVSRDVIFYESIALQKQKDLPMDYIDEELCILEEEGTKEEEK